MDRDAEAPAFDGLRIVLHESNRRGAVLRCLASVRWLAMRGAEILLVDGVAGLPSSDGTRAAVGQRFPGVHVVASPRQGGLEALLSCYAAPVPARPTGPRAVLRVSADLELDAFRVEQLLRELREQPKSIVLTTGLIGTDGAWLTTSRPRSQRHHPGRLDRWPAAWIAKASDLARLRSAERLRFVPSPVSFVTHKPS
ncbi:glycosyltransferase family 2 protein [Planctomycetes bacterium Poly30]|uniref:glycosyltransferase family 2 protein n=1 Tax=Saltatorellus ferox TaxID=2528018 RepID=UPI0011A3CF23